MHTLRSWFKYSLMFLFFIALIGTLLRYQFILPEPNINFKNFLHSHSHVAMLGWLFNSLFIFYVYYYLPDEIYAKSINILFYLIQAANAGMIIAFSIQGYALFSIAFSTLHLLLSYYFIYIFLNRIEKYKDIKSKHSLSLKYITFSLILLAVSSIGPWALAVFLARGGSSSAPFYSMAIYFYLHFLYNGFFTFGLIGLLIYLLEKNNAQINIKQFKAAYNILLISILPAYTHSLLGYNFHPSIHILAAISIIMQLSGIVIIFYGIYKKVIYILENISNTAKMLFWVGLYSLLLKYILLVLSLIPGLEKFVFNNREIVLAYLHLSLLGSLSFIVLALAENSGLISYKKITNQTGILLLIAGFIITELLLFIPGLNFFYDIGLLDNYYLYLFIGSIIMLFGTTLLFFNYFTVRDN